MLTEIILKGLTLRKFLSCLCMRVLIYARVGVDLVDWLDKGFICEKSLEICICL